MELLKDIFIQPLKWMRKVQSEDKVWFLGETDFAKGEWCVWS